MLARFDPNKFPTSEIKHRCEPPEVLLGTLCRFFGRRGGCKKGAECKYLHETTALSSDRRNWRDWRPERVAEFSIVEDEQPRPCTIVKPALVSEVSAKWAAARERVLLAVHKRKEMVYPHPWFEEEKQLKALGTRVRPFLQANAGGGVAVLTWRTTELAMCRKSPRERVYCVYRHNNLILFAKRRTDFMELARPDGGENKGMIFEEMVCTGGEGDYNVIVQGRLGNLTVFLAGEVDAVDEQGLVEVKYGSPAGYNLEQNCFQSLLTGTERICFYDKEFGEMNVQQGAATVSGELDIDFGTMSCVFAHFERTMAHKQLSILWLKDKVVKMFRVKEDQAGGDFAKPPQEMFL
jgi:hypothetical protein